MQKQANYRLKPIFAQFSLAEGRFRDSAKSSQCNRVT